jgi:hypothetical protein
MHWRERRGPKNVQANLRYFRPYVKFNGRGILEQCVWFSNNGLVLLLYPGRSLNLLTSSIVGLCLPRARCLTAVVPGSPGREGFVRRFQPSSHPIRTRLSRSSIALLLAGIILGTLAGAALATDTKKVADKPPAAAKAPADQICKTPNDASDKTQPAVSSADPAPGAEPGEGIGTVPSEDSMKIKSDLADPPQSQADSPQESTKGEGGDAADLSRKAEKAPAGPQQCERPAPKRDLTLPASGKDGSPE